MQVQGFSFLFFDPFKHAPQFVMCVSENTCRLKYREIELDRYEWCARAQQKQHNRQSTQLMISMEDKNEKRKRGQERENEERKEYINLCGCHKNEEKL